MGSKANSSSTQQTITNTVSDSYNETLNKVNNLSDVGNLSINLGGSDEPSTLGSSLMPLALGGAVLLAVAAIAWRKKA